MGTLILFGLGGLFLAYAAFALMTDGLPRLAGFLARKAVERKTINDRQPAP